MSDRRKKRVFLAHKKSSALFVSIVIHAVIIVAALFFVAVKTIIKPEQAFEAKPVNRPKMNLRKLQVPVNVKRPSQKPRLRQNIVAKTPTPQVNITMPEIVGVAGGTGYGAGGGFGPGFSLDLDMTLFGSDKGAGNDFVGTFYDLKQDAKGKLTKIGELVDEDSFNAEAQNLYRDVVNSFLRSGWNVRRLESFFQAPKKKYARFFNMPPMGADAAPKAYGVEDQVKPSYWLCHYQGTIVARTSGKYRFWGEGDDVLLVRIGKRMVLDGSWPETNGKLSSWKSSDENNRRFPINSSKYGSFKGGNYMDHFETIRRRLEDGDTMSPILGEIMVDGTSLSELGNYMNICNRLAVGDWFTLKAGQRVDMEVLIGEIPGGAFDCRLLIEQQGAEYPLVESDAGMRRVFPMFKTAQVPDKMVDQMEANPSEMSLTGPVFGIE
ncbi:MAG: hypothetical protein JXR25_08330 [Pontiellaceae bacterium]|nr:hypothetical protein [Pontiellaceae bacterium]MBN2784820.1 hypothetical protein [Pontiellaceae bacterium]